MSELGNKIRMMREEKALPLRTVAAYLDIDQAILSKWEKGNRKPSREQVTKLATYFKTDENELIVIWLADKLVYELADEEMALQALHLAEKQVKYLTTKNRKK